MVRGSTLPAGSGSAADAGSVRLPASRARGFTLVEILFSILILGVLMGLLFVAFRTSRRFASSVADRDAVNTIKMGVSRFIDDCGTIPPLVRDQRSTSPQTVVVDGAGIRRFSVYNFSLDEAANAADLLILRPATLTGATANNPFADQRFSERTIPVYLAGASDIALAPGASDAQAKTVPIDGVRGPGFYKARNDGTFEIPADVRKGGAATTSRGGGSKFVSLIDSTKSYLQVYQDPSNPEIIELRDKKGTPVRFYRWVNGAAYPQGTRTVYEVRTLDDLRLPPLVGRKASSFPGTPPEKDIEKSPELRDAKWAIVAAGPDGAFGDEPLALLGQRLGITVNASEERRVRIDAEKDNVVEVGK